MKFIASKNIFFFVAGTVVASAIFFGLYWNTHKKDTLVLKEIQKLAAGDQCLTPDDINNATSIEAATEGDRIYFVGCGGFF